MSHITEPPINRSLTRHQGNKLLQWIGALLLVELLIIPVALIGKRFKSATGQWDENLFTFASNPFLLLIVAIVAITLIQS